MRLLPALALLALAGGALATDYTTISFQASDGVSPVAMSPVFTSLNNSYIATLSPVPITSSTPALDISWTHRFDTTVTTATSPATAPYVMVTQVITGRLRTTNGQNGAVSFSSLLSEDVTDLSGIRVGSQSATVPFAGTYAGTDVPFTLMLTTPFSRPLAAGFAIKDDLFYNPGANTTFFVDRISQNYNAVPEPASMAALAIGAAALLRRRKRA